MGIALSIGVNFLDPNHYGNWDGKLNGCEHDAYAMSNISKSKNFSTTILLSRDATVVNVIQKIENATEILKSGDIFILTYAGHGGQIEDKNADEDDKKDETWCLYDRQLLDDELNYYLSKFHRGVRILVFSDSCHSGTITRAPRSNEKKINKYNSNCDNNGILYRFAPINVLSRTYKQHIKEYEKIIFNPEIKKFNGNINATVLTISGCQDDQLARDGPYNGLFTSNLLRTWDNGNFVGSYKEFHKQITEKMPNEQTPNYEVIGIANKDFEHQNPFTI